MPVVNTDWEPVDQAQSNSDWETVQQPESKLSAPPIVNFLNPQNDGLRPQGFERGIPPTIGQPTSDIPKVDWTPEMLAHQTPASPNDMQEGLVTSMPRAIVGDVAAGLSLLKKPDNYEVGLLPNPSGVISAISQNAKEAAPYTGNIAASVKGEKLPIDKVVADAASESIPAATLGKISLGIASTAPMAAIGTLPAALQKAALLAFTAKMVSDAPQIATELGSELGKPKDQQDPDKISSLVSDAIQVTGFSVLGGTHLANSGLNSVIKFGESKVPMGTGIQNDILSHGDTVKYTLPDNKTGIATVYNVDANGNAVAIDHKTGETITFPEKISQEGVPNALEITSATRVPVSEVRSGVGEATPLRQQGEAAAIPPGQEAGLPKEKVAPLNEVPKPSELISANPDQVIEWKRRVKYGPTTSLEIAKGITPDDVLKLTAERDSLNQNLDGLMAKAKEAKTQAESDAILNEFQKIQLKSQTINEVLRDHVELPKPESTLSATETIKNLPPVNEGFKRLYRGQEGAGGSGAHWTESPEYAASQGKNLQYLDVRENLLNGYKTGTVKDGLAKYQINDESAKYVRNVETPVSQKVQDLTPGEPVVTSAIRNDNRITVEFDASGKVPTTQELNDQFKNLGHDVEFIRIESPIASGRNVVRFRGTAVDQSGAYSSKVAKKAFKDAFGQEEDIRGKAAIRKTEETAVPIEPANVATPEMVGMGGATPKEFQNNPQTPTGIKNATVDAERAKRGLPPAIQSARRSFGKVWDEAMAKIDRDPGYPDRLINELRDKPRALTDLEDATLLQRQIDLQNEYGKATRDLAQAYDDGRLDDVEELKVRTAGWSDKLLDLYNIGKKVGTETGRGLNARKMMAYEDFSLAQMETSKRAANGGRPLTEAERSEITKLNQKITDLQKRYDDLVAAQDAKQAKPEIESVLNDTKKSVEKSPNKFTELPNIREIRNKIGNKLVENELADVSGLVQKLVRAFVEENPKITRDELVNKVHGVLSEFVPDITRRDAMDAISGYGDFKPLSKDAISMVVRDLKGQLQQIGKLEDMASGNAPKKTGIERRTPSDEERRLIKQVEEEKRKGGYKVTDPETQLRTAMQAVKTRLENQIKDLESQIESRQKIVKTKTRLQYDEEANRLRARRDELKKQFDEIFPRQPISDAQRLENWKKRTQARIEELNQKLADRDFSKRTQRPPPPMDEAANKLQAELFRAKQSFQRGLIEDRLKSRPWWSKAQDTFLRWYRGGLLSSPVVFAKLTTAAIVRAGLTPIEEAVGGGIGKVFPKLSKNAPREGFWNSNAEAKAITSQLTKGPRDAWDLLTKGETNLDVLYGKGREGAIGESRVRPFSIADIPGRLHGAIKASTKRAEFERSLEKRLTYAIRNGADASNPAVQLEAAIGAYKDANRSIFLQDNLVVSAYQAALRRFEQPNKATGQASLGGKTVTTLARTLVPIVRVPSNIVAEAFQFATGAVTGSARLAKAYAKGIETLPPEQADLIMRELKKGSIGTAALLVGYLLPNAFGGYYQRGEKRNPNDIKAGEAKIGNVDISSKLMHHPVFETIQAGSTVRRISESKAGKEAGNLAIPMGVKAAALGLIEAVPFIREMVETAKAFDPSQQNAYFGELAKSISEPQLLQWIAGKVDTTPTGEAVTRKPKTFVEHLKMGIPGLRQTVPEKNAPKPSKSVFTP